MCRWPRWRPSSLLTDPQQRAEVIAGYLQRLEDELDRTRAAVVLRCAGCCARIPAEIEVELQSLPVRTVAAVKGQVQPDESLS